MQIGRNDPCPCGSGKKYKKLVDTKLPALRGKTPRQAVITSDGREAVEALLADAERMGPGDPVMGDLNRSGVRRARELLGLTRHQE